MEKRNPNSIPELEDANSCEFGSIEGMDCTMGVTYCSKQYDDPIVFLMSTINPDDIK
ncbi:hypothetical protein OH492_22465 [Vibrio chagasii]|nr:hypothetical protein [Vibrio chagasii]